MTVDSPAAAVLHWLLSSYWGTVATILFAIYCCAKGEA